MDNRINWITFYVPYIQGTTDRTAKLVNKKGRCTFMKPVGKILSCMRAF